MKPVIRIATAILALSPIVAAAQTSGLTRQQVVDDLVRAERAGYYPGVDDQRYPGSFLDIKDGIYTGASVYRPARPLNVPANTDDSSAN
ncbi:DUF4148 domain-containing protein [Caballeronia concitans]|uniref:Purine nucleoside phosphorylase n=1 Tax=Caballeronia concitans TaxID=1777133 RepID=A0A658QVZ8_9BURK|nr:DUF4148 domain-containing protein [Caballeronia concitans]KIG03617.1 Protein of unknown function DUF4148 [Burkholderia sp. MR1]SAL27133.1 hypothetical protein AWB72_02126 [Caballeronia concitans]